MAFFNINGFQAALIGGGARANQFVVRLNYPAAAQPANSLDSALGTAEFLVTGASLPGSVVNPTVVPYRGREIKFAGERTFAPWTITVLNDTQFTIRNNMENWMNRMNNLVFNGGILSPAEYQSNIEVTQLDRNNLPLKTYQLVGAFPTDISDIALNFGDNDTIETFTVTFQYQYYNTDFSPVFPVY